MDEYLRNGNTRNMVAYYHLVFWRANSGIYIQKTLKNITRMQELATNFHSKYILYCAKKELEDSIGTIYRKGHFRLN